MGKHVKIDQTWIENRFRQRKRMTGKKLYLDKETGFLTSPTSNGFYVEKKKQFLKRFEVCSNILQIAKSLLIDIQTVYDHLAMDLKFREEFNRLDQIENKAKQLDDALINITRNEERAFISDLAKLAQSYKVQ